MRKYFKFIIMGVVLVAFGIFGCQEEEPAAPISPDSYPVATFKLDYTGTEFREGDTITVSVTTDKPIDTDTPFEIVQTGGDAEEGVDYVFVNGVIPAYKKSGIASIIMLVDADGVPDLETKTLDLEVEITNLAHKYKVHPSTTSVTSSLTIQNGNDPANLVIAFGWDTPDDDFDVYLIDEAFTRFINYAETGDIPELLVYANTEPDEVSYFEVWPYAVASTSNFTFTIGHPDQTVQVLNGVWDTSLESTYTPRYGYIVMKIVKVGSTYTCTLEPPF